MTKNQQALIYAAQCVVPPDPYFGDIAQAQLFVDILRDQPWWDRTYSKVAYVEVGATRRNATKSVGWWDAEHNAGRIELCASGMQARTVVHELAHVVADALDGSTAHDPTFARRFVELTYHALGVEAYVALTTSFDAHGVEYLKEER